MPSKTARDTKPVAELPPPSELNDREKDFLTSSATQAMAGILANAHAETSPESVAQLSWNYALWMLAKKPEGILETEPAQQPAQAQSQKPVRKQQ